VDRTQSRELGPTASGQKKRPPGRPRSADLHESVLRATRELLVEGSYGSLTIEGVAARAGVGKPSIYRRWNNKGLLVWEAVVGKTVSARLPDSGRIEDDLRTVLRWGFDMVAVPEARAALPGMLADFEANPELERLVRERLLEPEYARIRMVFERAVERGEVRSDVDLNVVMDTMIGLMLGCALMFVRPIDEALVEALVDLVLHGVGPRGHLR
jgi:AcrR family transcriptional regulator